MHKISGNNVVVYHHHIYHCSSHVIGLFFFQVVEVAKEVTGESVNETAIKKFRNILNSSASYFNEEPFPEIESNKTAHARCSSIEGAKKYCPKRWAALELWMAESRRASF